MSNFPFQINQNVTNEEICSSLKVSSQGGMRKSVKTNVHF